MGGRGGSSHRRTGGGLSSLTTTAQVSDWIRHQHWFQPHSFVNLDGVDVVAAREIAVAYHQVFDRYPQLIGAFSGVKSFDLGNGVYADCNLQTGQIRVSDTMYRNAQALARQYASDIRSNWHPAGTDWQAIITHEIGHAIDGFISQKLDVGGRSFYRDWYQNSAMLQKKVADKLNIAPTRDRISKEVSRYGASNTAEWFAEAFAEGMRSSTPRRMAVELMKELDEIMRRLR